ncbi:MAG: GumC family protein [Thiogranum sp.]
MEQQDLDLTDYLDAFKRRHRSIIAIAILVFLIGAMVGLLWPPTYKSTATILIKEQDIPPDLVRSTVTSFASQRIQAISQKVMARPNLLEIINKYGVYKDQTARLTTEELVAQMRENITFDLIDANVVDPRTGRPMAATIAFHVGFTGNNPAQVQKVANELMSLYLKENLKERSQQASQTYSFLNDESKRLSGEIADLEAKLAKFKEENANVLPEVRDLNQTQMEQTQRALSDIESQTNALQQTLVYLESQLSQLKPFESTREADPKLRLQALRTEYLRLLARYSPDHPDVVRTRREIEGLERETGRVDNSAEQLKKIEELRVQRAALAEKYSAQHPDVVAVERQIAALEKGMSSDTTAAAPALMSQAANNPDNPAYIQLQTQIETTRAKIRALREQKTAQEARLAEYAQRLAQTPQVEREYRQLDRNLKNTTAEYENIHGKLVTAEIGQELEKDSKGERFEIIEPPILPEEPISPNRPAILFLSFVLAIGLGFGYAIIAESLDDAVHSSKAVAMAVGSTPLAVIPYITNAQEISRRKRRIVTGAAAAATALILAIGAIHYFYKPLDVLWYRALRKADVVVNS